MLSHDARLRLDGVVAADVVVAITGSIISLAFTRLADRQDTLWQCWLSCMCVDAVLPSSFPKDAKLTCKQVVLLAWFGMLQASFCCMTNRIGQ